MNPLAQCLTLSLTLCALLPATPLLSHADQISLPASADAGLFEPNPFNNLGGTPDVASGTTANGQLTRALFKFDVAGSDIPSGAVITSAALTLRVVKQSFATPEDSTFGLHRVLRDWGEGAKNTPLNGSAAATGECSWLARSAPITLWGAAGGQSGTDYASTASGSQFIAGLAHYTFTSTPNMVADVQVWLDNPSSNFGWMLISQSENTAETARRIATREHPTASFKPALVIDFDADLLLENVQLVGNQIQFQFPGKAGKSYVAQKTTALLASDWTSFFTVPTLSQDQTVTINDSPSSGTHFYRIEIQ